MADAMAGAKQPEKQAAANQHVEYIIEEFGSTPGQTAPNPGPVPQVQAYPAPVGQQARPPYPPTYAYPGASQQVAYATYAPPAGYAYPPPPGYYQPAPAYYQAPAPGYYPQPQPAPMTVYAPAGHPYQPLYSTQVWPPPPPQPQPSYQVTVVTPGPALFSPYPYRRWPF